MTSPYRNMKTLLAVGVIAALVSAFSGFTLSDLPQVSAARMWLGAIGAVLGIVIASLKNRDAAAWCVAGAIAPVVTIIVLLAVPDLDIADERRRTSP
jgi:uncharacterized protein YacL